MATVSPLSIVNVTPSRATRVRFSPRLRESLRRNSFRSSRTSTAASFWTRTASLTASCTSIIRCSFEELRSEKRANQRPALVVGPGNRYLRYARRASQLGHLSDRRGRGQPRFATSSRASTRSAPATIAVSAASSDVADHSVPRGTVARARSAATRRARLVASPSVALNPTVHAVKRATPTASSVPIQLASGSLGVSDRLLESCGDGDDPQHEPVVPVAEPEEREPRPSRGRGGPHGALDILLVTEVQPPESRTQRERQERHEHQPEIDGDSGSSRADDDDRLPEHDDDHEPVPLDEVLCGDDEALGAREPRGDPDEDRGARP